MTSTQWMKSLINWLSRLGPQEITVSKGLFQAYFFHVIIGRASEASLAGNGAQLATRGRRDMSSRVRDVVLSLALCHNVSRWTLANDTFFH
jgi:hypothetical protein